ncbi:MAG: hypothetical protein ACI8RD_011440 [Bacillariaceae sp.]|jgi:hypothetical protein
MPKQPLYTKLESLEAAIIKEKKIQETGHTVLVESGKADRGGGGVQVDLWATRTAIQQNVSAVIALAGKQYNHED